MRLRPKHPILAWIKRLFMQPARRQRHDALKRWMEDELERSARRGVEEYLLGRVSGDQGAKP